MSIFEGSVKITGADEIARYGLRKKSVHLGRPLRLVLISDSHVTRFGGHFNKNIFVDGLKAISKIKNVDYIIHLGDITDKGVVDDYELLNELLDKHINPETREKIYFVPGNHDSKNLGYQLFEEYLHPKRDFTLELGNDSVILGLDSTKPDENIGEIGARAIDILDKELDNYQELKMVCFHHQLVPIPRTGRERSAIIDAGNILKLLLDENVNLVLNGHRHITNLYSITDGKDELLVFNVGTFSSTKTRYKQLWTYTILDINNEHVEFKVKCIKQRNDSLEFMRPFVRYKEVKEPDGELIAKIVHLANTGFTANNDHDNKSWEQACDIINSLESDLVVHAGSLVDSSYKEDFKYAASLLGDINQPLITIPGLSEMHYPKSKLYYTKYIGALDPVFTNDQLHIIGINTCKQQTKTGEIGRKRMDDVLDAVNQCQNGELLGVVLHHDIIPSPNERWEYTLADSGEALGKFANSGVKFVLSGGSYANWSVQVENAVFSSTSSVSNKKCLLYSFRNSFNFLETYTDGTMKISEYLIQDRKWRHRRMFKVPLSHP